MLEKLRHSSGTYLENGMGFLCFCLFYSVINLAFYHIPFFSYLHERLSFFSVEAVLVIATCLLLFYLLTIVFLLPFYLLGGTVLKAFCFILLCLNASAFFFISSLNIEIDKVLIGNILNTRYQEAIELIQGDFVLYLLLLGVLPGCLLFCIKLSRYRPLSAIARSICLLLAMLPCFYLMSGSWLWIDKHASRVGGLLLPWAYVVDSVRYGLDYHKTNQQQALLPELTQNKKHGKTIVVLVIGETARKHNFSVYDYSKDTNPNMQKLGAVALQNTVACATYTTAALSCMLSHQKTGNRFSAQYEPLPSYLQRHGVDVIWRTNNWGEPKLKVNSYISAPELRKSCQGPDCAYDGVLLHGLKRQIANSAAENILVVLHQNGSHGPSYHTRYPKRFARFGPVCTSLDVNKCSYEQLVNAYDNSILYTDHLLSEVVGLLKEFTDTASLMMYISDHGESLGEYGLYLHGTPYSVAPEYQTEIPYLFWASESFQQAHNFSSVDFPQAQQHSQYNVFHSILGAFAMQSDVYVSALDIFNYPMAQGQQ